MLKRLSRACWRLDEWLQERFGRPYVLILGIGLITDIVHRTIELQERIAKSHGFVGIAFGLIVELGLLIHQVGELHHHFGWYPKEAALEHGPVAHVVEHKPRLSRRRRRNEED